LSNNKKPVILILSGPSGAGKTTLSHTLIAAVPDSIEAVSHTTRAPRTGEKEGEDYFFVSEAEFHRLVNRGEMLEYAEVYGNLYGTSRNSIEHALREGKNIILDIDWQGARHIKSIYPDAVSVYILPPAQRESEKRLISRQQDSDETIKSRMAEYKEQLSHQSEFDHVIINDRLSDATRELVRILHFG
jgi:guanylate kinase